MTDNSAQEEAKSNTQEQVSPHFPAPEISLIDKAEAIAVRIETANKIAEELVARNEQAVAKLILGGRAEAGQVMKTPAQIEQEEIDRQIAERLKG